MNNPKEQARILVQARLDDVSPDQYVSFSEIVLGRVQAHFLELQKERSISSALLYRAAPKWREVNLTPLEAAFKDVQFDYAPTSMKAPLPAGTYDVIVVPLYGFNSDNYRLGHGSGWYDSFLASQPQAYTIGVGLTKGLVDFEPEAHDIPLDIIITEEVSTA